MRRLLTFVGLLIPMLVAAQGPVLRNPVTTNQFMNLPQNGWIAIWNNVAQKWSNGVNTASATNDSQPPSTVLSNLTATGVSPGATNPSAYIASLSGLGSNTHIKALVGTSRALLVNTNVLVVTNGNVGIGTDAPGAKLQVVGAIAVNGGVTATTADIFAGSGASFSDDNFAGEKILQTGNGPNAAIEESSVTTQELLDLVAGGTANNKIANLNGLGTNTSITTRLTVNGILEATNGKIVLGHLGAPLVMTNYNATFQRAQLTLNDSGNSIDVRDGAFIEVNAGGAIILGADGSGVNRIQFTDGDYISSPLGGTSDNNEIFRYRLWGDTSTSAITNRVQRWWEVSNYVASVSVGGSGTPAGNSGAVQFNEGGAFAGTNRFLYDRTNEVLSLVGSSAGSVRLYDSDSSHSVNLIGAATLSSNLNLTFPAGYSNGVLTISSVNDSNFNLGVVPAFAAGITPSVSLLTYGTNNWIDGGVSSLYSNAFSASPGVTNILPTNLLDHATVTIWVNPAAGVTVGFPSITASQWGGAVPFIETNGHWTRVEITRRGNVTNATYYPFGWQIAAGANVTLTSNFVTGVIEIASTGGGESPTSNYGPTATPAIPAGSWRGIFFGDSHMLGSGGSGISSNMPSQLTNLYAYPAGWDFFIATNWSFGGMKVTTNFGGASGGWTNTAAALMNKGATNDLVSIIGGLNDIFWGTNVLQLIRYYSNLCGALTTLGAEKIILHTLPPAANIADVTANPLEDIRTEYNSELAARFSTFGTNVYLAHYDEVLGSPPSSKWNSDGAHPSDIGYQNYAREEWRTLLAGAGNPLATPIIHHRQSPTYGTFSHRGAAVSFLGAGGGFSFQRMNGTSEEDLLNFSIADDVGVFAFRPSTGNPAVNDNRMAFNPLGTHFHTNVFLDSKAGLYATGAVNILSGSLGAGKVLTDVSGNGAATWQTPSGGGGSSIATLRAHVDLFEEFLHYFYPVITVSSLGPLGLSKGLAGAGSAIGALGGETNAPGVAVMTCGTTTTGIAFLVAQQDAIRFSLGAYTNEWRVRVDTMPSFTESYIARVGFGDVGTGLDAVDGVYFRWSTNTANFVCVTRSNSSESSVTNTTAVTAAAWVKLRIVVNAAGTSAVFTVNDADAQTLTTNIPIGVGRQTGLWATITKDAGTTAPSISLDYCYLGYDVNR